MSQRIPVRVHYGEQGKPLRPFYSATGYVNVDFTLTEPDRRMYDHLSSFHNHFRYMRMHNTLTAHGRGDYFLLQQGQNFGNAGGTAPGTADRVVSINADGKLIYNWDTLDRVYDLLLQQGIRPIVETTFLPSCIRKSAELWYIPRDFRLWREIIAVFIHHLLERYGTAELRQWYFEIWNEPDIFPAWQQDPQTFFALYDYLEDALHAADPSLKVGGPATTQSEQGRVLFRRFLEHCSDGLNTASGRFGSRIDFLSVHCKGGQVTDTNPSTRLIFDSVRQYLDIIQEFPQFRDIEFINDESGIVWGGHLGTAAAGWLNFRNTHYSAGFICKLVDRYCRIVEDEYEMTMGIMDIDNCQLQWERKLFSGNRSQFTPLNSYPTTNLLRKAVFNAYVLLSRLGNTRLPVSCDDPDFGNKFGVLPTRTGNVLAVMVWNFEDGMDDLVNPRQLTITLADLPLSGVYTQVHYRIDNTHSSAYNVWAAQGKPEAPTLEQVADLRAAEGLQLYEPVQEVSLVREHSLTVELPQHAVSLYLLLPRSREKPEPPGWIMAEIETNFLHCAQVFLKWQPSPEPDFLHYRLWRSEAAPEAEPALICDNPSLNTAVYIDTAVESGRAYRYSVQVVNAASVGSDLSTESTVKIP